MKSAPIIAIGTALFTLALGGTLFGLNRTRRAEIQTRMTESAVPTAAETALPEPTDTPMPTATAAPQPTAAELPHPSPTAAPDPERWQEWPELPDHVSEAMKTLYREGIAAGNSPNRFSKVGDSNTITGAYFSCFDAGEDSGYVLGPYTDLREVIEQFQWSFSRVTRAAKNGATALDMDTYHWYSDDVCWPYESALNCEYRLYTPSIAFIGFGTNDALMDIALYEEHLRSLVEKTLERQIVPILFTKADNLEGDGSFNAVTAKVAAEYDVPLWNLWRAMSALPNNGLKEGDVHPTSNDTCLCDFSGADLSQYGWTVRNLSALRALDRVWRLLNEMPLHDQ